MQKTSYFFAFTLILAASFLSSCDDNSNSNNNGVTPAAGNWKVVYFLSKEDETSNYAGYVFDFSSNGSITVTKNGQTYSGAWTTGFDDSKDKFLMTFSGGAPSALLELQEDWLVIKMDDSVMQFEHTSGGNGNTEVLHFKKS